MAATSELPGRLPGRLVPAPGSRLRPGFRAKVLLIAFAVNALCTLVFALDTYEDSRRLVVKGMDERLHAAALALPKILPDDFHDRVVKARAVAPQERLELFRTLTNYARAVKLKYIYAYVKEGEHFYETASSGLPGQLSGGPVTPFFYQAQQPPAAMTKAWETDTVQYAEYTDEWGSFRSVFVPVRSAHGQRFLAGADIPLAELHEELRDSIVEALAIGLAIFVVAGAASHVVLRRVLDPVTGLARRVGELPASGFVLSPDAHEELERIRQGHPDEIGTLAQTIAAISDQLGIYLQRLQETTAAKERIESELRVAHDIQMSFLKKLFPPFPRRSDFTLFALLEPAREVGGDLYDFALIDERRLVFYVGDVSDKGVPAALVMAVTMTLMRRAAQQPGATPAGILGEVNAALSEGNESAMFVTLFIGILDVATGELVYSNAGHNPPVIVRSDGTASFLALPDGLVLGVMADTPYRDETSRLQPDDMIVVYTDGVTEAMSPARELYSEARLQAALQATGARGVEDTARGVLASVKAHAAGAPQSDDIALLVLARTGEAP